MDLKSKSARIYAYLQQHGVKNASAILYRAAAGRRVIARYCTQENLAELANRCSSFDPRSWAPTRGTRLLRRWPANIAYATEANKYCFAAADKWNMDGNGVVVPNVLTARRRLWER